MRLYVARHSECAKNLIGIPGGAGSSLTPQGLAQARRLAERLVNGKSKPARIIACPPIQTRETAAILAERLDVPLEVKDELRSIGLGVLAGIPVAEARRLHPPSSISMDRWRAGQVELCDVKIEGMEDPLRFFCRGLRYLLTYLAKGEFEMIIATTSIMILVDNLHRMHGPAPGEGYRVREYENAELLKLEFSAKHEQWLHMQAQKHDVF